MACHTHCSKTHTHAHAHTDRGTQETQGREIHKRNTMNDRRPCRSLDTWGLIGISHVAVVLKHISSGTGDVFCVSLHLCLTRDVVFPQRYIYIKYILGLSSD